MRTFLASNKAGPKAMNKINLREGCERIAALDITDAEAVMGLEAHHTLIPGGKSTMEERWRLVGNAVNVHMLVHLLAPLHRLFAPQENSGSSGSHSMEDDGRRE